MRVTTLFKAHGLGNDYLVAEDGDGAVDASWVRAVCDRHRGVGGDGVLEPLPSARAPIGVRIWNPDGSVAEKSGNGLRILAWWAARHRGLGRSFDVEVGGGLVTCTVDGTDVDVEMGRASFAAADVPTDRERIDAPLDVDGAELRVVAVGVGNPHCVVFVTDPVDAVPWRAWGAAIERHAAFPNRTNVQIARVTGTAAVEVRVWERGAGPTLASGSSACAVAAAAVRTGRIARDHARAGVAVVMPGGTLSVAVSDGDHLRLSGPVGPVGRIVLDAGWSPA